MTAVDVTDTARYLANLISDDERINAESHRYACAQIGIDPIDADITNRIPESDPRHFQYYAHCQAYANKVIATCLADLIEPVVL